jgi:uncharacterized protein (DUF433 family)
LRENVEPGTTKAVRKGGLLYFPFTWAAKPATMDFKEEPAMSKVDHRNIEKVPDRQGGRAVIAGTRIRVSLILDCYRQAMTVEEIVQQYPHLRPADVHDALAYAYDHPEEMDADLAADDEQEAQRLWPGGPGRP